MLPAVTGITFLATVLVLLALVYAFAPSDDGITARSKEMMNAAASRAPEQKFATKQKVRARDFLANIGRLLPVSADATATRAQVLMMRAGYRSADAVLAIRGMKVLSPVV